MSQFLALARAYPSAGSIPARRILALNPAGGVKLAAGAKDRLIGVSSDLDSRAGSACDVLLSGLHKLIAGGPIAPGDLVTSDAEGKAVAAQAGNRVLGLALEDAGAAGDILEVLLAPGLA